jgi:septum formation protein
LNSQQIVLASTSIYRSQLLSTLQLPFVTASPDIDETPLPGEAPKLTALRLSQLKARSVAQHYSNALIIGSDQVAYLDDQQMGKPLTHDNAVIQLRKMRGRTVDFFTAVSLLNAQTDDMQTALVETEVSFRDLSDHEIERYLTKEKPYHCAGSAKTEGLGIALIKRIEGDDPNALIGLPLILLVDMLMKQGVEIL